MDLVLTLQIPKVGRKRPISIAATADHDAMLAFKRCVIAGYARSLRNADNEFEAMYLRSQYEHMQRVLDALIPAEGKHDH